jgi:signal transduction histidine kinase
LLDVARLERDRASSQPEELRLDEVIRGCANAVGQRYPDRRSAIQLDLPPTKVVASRVDVELVFRNLIDNAVKYADEQQPRVEVSIRQETPTAVVVRVSDNGHGIPPLLRRQIFGRFVRLGSELEREKPGTGLGLYIVRTMIGRLSGAIRVRDQDRGTGAVFEVQLPGQTLRIRGDAAA